VDTLPAVFDSPRARKFQPVGLLPLLRWGGGAMGAVGRSAERRRCRSNDLWFAWACIPLTRP